jgi:hypothetical protein
MVCWGKPGNTPTPIACPEEGTPYVDCIAYGSYSGPTNACIGTPHPLAPNGRSLERVGDTNNNALDFECGDPAGPKNNANESASLPATDPCVATTTTTTTIAIDTTTTTVVETSVCGDANGDGGVTASDALGALRTAVGSGSCPTGTCDVDDNGTVSAADALRILARAVGQSVELTCPAA